MGGEKILWHTRQEARLRCHSLLRRGLCNDLLWCVIYGMQTHTGRDGRAGEGQEGSGKALEAALVRAKPSVLGSMLHQMCWS